MLYTVIGLGDVFAGEKVRFYDTRMGNSWLTVREYANVKSVERLVSTNPYDYLNPYFLPGRDFDRKSIDIYMKSTGKESFSNGKQLKFKQKKQHVIKEEIDCTGAEI
ncbi:MAG: hypothetical protein IJC37_06475 [Clostridia bacterium]|nr:hypothetical protein [Clostridia bacterium]